MHDDTIYTSYQWELLIAKKLDGPSHRYTWCILLLSWGHCRGVRNSMNGLVHGLRSNQAKMVEFSH